LSLAFGGCEEYDRIRGALGVVRDIEQNNVREESLTGIRILFENLYYKSYKQSESHYCPVFRRKIDNPVTKDQRP
jgi:hypothetical protein